MYILSRITVVFLVIFSSLIVRSQDTLRIMHYNSLYYGAVTSFCTAQNNDIFLKNEQLSIIIDHIKPDIFTVNEMGRGTEILAQMRDNALNRSTPGKYEHADYTNTPNSTIVNGMFYNTQKLVLHHQAIPNTLLRDINLYRFYYNDPMLAQGADTVFITCIVAHLKAGDSSSDQQTRTMMVNNVMQFLEAGNYSGNIMFIGDFNMKSSFEQAFQAMVNHPNALLRFHDPINISGVWSNNPDMAPYHTQSPRSQSHSCFVAGGLDDRFDFILATEALMKGTNGLQYLEGSYKAIGQDGLRFNQSVISPPNYSEPQHVITAMYNFSDHLPVSMDVVLNKVSSSRPMAMDVIPSIVSVSSISNNKFTLTFEHIDAGPLTVNLYNLNGQPVISSHAIFANSGDNITLTIPTCTETIYIVQVILPNSEVVVKKIVRL